MIRLLFKISVLNLLLLLTGFLCFDFTDAKKPVDTIVLHDDKLQITPGEFYIADMTDERADKSGIGRLLQVGSGETLVSVDLQGGFLPALTTFANHNVSKNVDLRPVVISFKKFMVTEAALPGGLANGHINIVMSFGLQSGDSTRHLIDYNGTAVYERPARTAQQIEPSLRNMLESGLNYFNTWINTQASSNIELAKSVAIGFSDRLETPGGDTIYYSAKRPLTWDDFKSKTPSKRFDAEIYPTFGYSERTSVKDAIINLNLEISVSLPKSACWVRGGSMDAYTLNHEQRHFDIAKIVAEHFKRKIKAELLPVDNYDGPINVDYLDAYREMDSAQMAYDRETNHGADRYAQEEWNEKIDRELRSPGSLKGE